MTSNPPGSCCVKGVVHTGTAIGEYSKVGDIDVYRVYPKDKKTYKAILLITDVFGHRLINSQLIADQLAANGYFVLMPDLFYGDNMTVDRPADFDVPKWMQGGYSKDGIAHLPPVIDPIIEKCLHELRTAYNAKRIGAVGYCFGGKYVMRYLRSGADKIDVGYTAHPSFVTADELMAVTAPLAISAAESDYIFTTEKRHETESILKASGVAYQINLYAAVQHGFAVRGDLSDRTVVYAKENAFLQALQWFQEHL